MCKREIIPTTCTTKMRILVVLVPSVLNNLSGPQNQWNVNNEYSHFCSTGCWNDFAFAHWEEFTRLHPRTEPLETPIDVKVETRQDYYGRDYKTKVIQAIDNA